MSKLFGIIEINCLVLFAKSPDVGQKDWDFEGGESHCTA